MDGCSSGARLERLRLRFPEHEGSILLAPTPSICANCGQRPGVVEVLMTAGGERVTGSLCDVCAPQLLGAPTAPRGGARGGLRQAPAQQAEPQTATPALDEFGRDLTAEAAAGRIDPVIGRADEIAQTVEILARRRKNNAVLIGEPGVGKTAIVEGLAARVADGDVPEPLRGSRVVALDLGGMLAGAQYRGQFEQRLKAALEEAADPDNGVLLFVDELHTILGAGAAEGAMDAANILKPLLARGELRMVGATTLAEYRKIERDGALARRFSAVTVDEPSVDETIAVLQGLRAAYEEHHGCAIADEALVAAAKLSDRYVTEYHLPDKAIDLVDQAAARVRLAAGGDPASERTHLRAELERARAEKDAAVADEAYERAGELKARCDRLEARLAELAGD
ncbi:MAG: ATP-dependent Clp protease ATP-binding subunit, partial [Solirubrobacterales bacterium]|nr:ATP-dependent Clp protease ATP-binding subunit [Solirubrobacterales bacterium]